MKYIIVLILLINTAIVVFGVKLLLKPTYSTYCHQGVEYLENSKGGIVATISLEGNPIKCDRWKFDEKNGK